MVNPSSLAPSSQRFIDVRITSLARSMLFVDYMTLPHLIYVWGDTASTQDTFFELGLTFINSIANMSLWLL